MLDFYNLNSLPYLYQASRIQHRVSGNKYPAEENYMIDKDTKKRLKKVQREIKKVKKEFGRTELRPCQNDAELEQKEEDLKELGNRLRALEKEQDRYILDTGRVKHSI
jgi:septal ring factor EnvC (AmiA/AmiB activator)